MRDQSAFEARLADAFDRYAAAAPLAVDAPAMARSIAAAHTARPTLVERWTAIFGARRLAPVLLLLLLALATAVVGALALRLLDRETRVFGAFESISGWAPGNFDDAVALADGRVLVLQAANEGSSRLYDPRTGTAEPVGRMPQQRWNARLVALPDGRAVDLFGVVDDPASGTQVEQLSALVFDPATGSFIETEPAPVFRMFPTVALLHDGRVLVIGGDVWQGGGPTTGAEVFDPGTGRFSSTGDPTIVRAGAAAVTLADGHVLVAGGWTVDAGTGSVPTAIAELYDPTTGRFAPTGSMTAARGGLTLTLLADGRVLVAGGQDGTGALRTAEVYDPARGGFAATGSLTTEREGHVATLLPDGRVLVTGGSNAYGEPRTAEVYDPAAGRFELAGRTTAGTWRAASQADGSVVVVGTGQPERWHAIAPVARASTARVPGAGFTATGSPAESRTGHTATLLADGRVLITGGNTRESMADPPYHVLRSAEVFDPRSGAFESVGDMDRPRAGHAAARLPDGQVLVVGGGDSTNPSGDVTPLTAELFDPSTGRFGLLDGRIAWGRTGCTVGLVALRDGRALLFAACPSGDATQVFDPAAGWGEPRTFEPVGCRASDPLGGGPHVLAAGDDVVVLCPGSGAAGYLVDADDGSVTPLDPAVLEPSSITGAATLSDGRVLLVTERDVRILDPATGTVTPSGPLADHRAGGRVTVLPDDRALITGGRAATTSGQGQGGPPLAAADTWDPTVGLRVVGPMTTGRAGHTATVLSDGRVLLVGGVERSPDRTDPEPVGAEIFDPAAVLAAGTAPPAP